jgi:hypothetical protein
LLQNDESQTKYVLNSVKPEYVKERERELQLNKESETLADETTKQG